MRLPDFLLIGAARSGTTTLYRDLLTHPSIFFPVTKEPGNLTRDDVLTPEGRQAYSRLFDAAAPGALCGDATTRYTHRPNFEGVAGRARHVLGADLKCLYIVRNPIDKIISTHHLNVSRGLGSADINVAVREDASLLDHARYAMQIEPWVEQFGRDQIRVVHFESYVENRRAMVVELEAFLGIEPRGDLVRAGRAYNRSRDETRPAGPFARVIRNPAYRRLLRPLLPPDVRTWLRRRTLPSMPDRPLPPTAETIAFIDSNLADDLARQPALFGTAEVFWDLAGTT